MFQPTFTIRSEYKQKTVDDEKVCYCDTVLHPTPDEQSSNITTSCPSTIPPHNHHHHWHRIAAYCNHASLLSTFYIIDIILSPLESFVQLGGVGRTDDMTVLWILCLYWEGYMVPIVFCLQEQHPVSVCALYCLWDSQKLQSHRMLRKALRLNRSAALKRPAHPPQYKTSTKERPPYNHLIIAIKIPAETARYRVVSGEAHIALEPGESGKWEHIAAYVIGKLGNGTFTQSLVPRASTEAVTLPNKASSFL